MSLPLAWVDPQPTAPSCTGKTRSRNHTRYPRWTQHWNYILGKQCGAHAWPHRIHGTAKTQSTKSATRKRRRPETGPKSWTTCPSSPHTCPDCSTPVHLRPKRKSTPKRSIQPSARLKVTHGPSPHATWRLHQVFVEPTCCSECPTIWLTDPAPVRSDMQLRRDRGIRCSQLVSRPMHCASHEHPTDAVSPPFVPQ